MAPTWNRSLGMYTEQVSHITETTTDFNGCLSEVDNIWGIAWPNTPLDHISVQSCAEEDDVIGKIYTHAYSNGITCYIDVFFRRCYTSL